MLEAAMVSACDKASYMKQKCIRQDYEEYKTN